MATPQTPNLGIDAGARESLVQVLNTLLADEYVLYTKTRNYHWNVTGPHFHDYHLLFEKQYRELDGIIDEVAEYARSLGGAALGSLTSFLQAARLQEGGAAVSAGAMISQLLADHEALVRSLRADVDAAVRLNEAGAADLLTGFLEQHAKMAWMLRATLGA